VRGDTSLLIAFPKLSSESRSRRTCDTIRGTLAPSPPDPSPALGRGEPNSINSEGRSPSSLYSVILNKNRSRPRKKAEDDDEKLLFPVAALEHSMRGCFENGKQSNRKT